MSDHDWRIAKQMAEDADALQDELSRLRAEVEELRAIGEGKQGLRRAMAEDVIDFFDGKIAEHDLVIGRLEEANNRLRAEVKRRGELLRRALPHLWIRLHGPAPETDKSRNAAFACIKEIEALSDEN